jgi:hypothetical protein
MMTVVKSGISHVQEHKNTRHHCQHSHISIVAPVCYRIVYVRVSSGRYEELSRNRCSGFLTQLSGSGGAMVLMIIARALFV